MPHDLLSGPPLCEMPENYLCQLRSQTGIFSFFGLYFRALYRNMHNQHKLKRVLQLIQLLKSEPPKNIRYLSEVLQSTDRTVYRYLDLLKAVGFIVDRDEHKRVYINHHEVGMPAFTGEEASLIRKTIGMAGKKTKLHDSILNKLEEPGEVSRSGEHLLQAHLGKIIDDLQTAIKEQRKVVLLNYHSVHSNSISDRKVDPLGFSANFQSLIAFEPASGSVKLFNTERITRVTIMRRRFERSVNHVPQEIDAFGFSAGKKRFRVTLQLNMRASVLMKERYPLTVSCIRPGRKRGFFLFEAQVFDLKPIAHFVLGFPDDVTVIEGEPLKAQIKAMVKKLLDK